jgi:hypothetical protein
MLHYAECGRLESSPVQKSDTGSLTNGKWCGGSDRSRSAQSESINESLEEVLALGLAKSAALGTFPTDAERGEALYDEDPPIWYQDRPPVMNERPCDSEDNGIRAWRVV